MEHYLLICKEWSLTGICIRLALATIAGILIGMDREYKNKGAGIKTHALVCVGSAMAMIVNEYVLFAFPSSNTDLTRIGAQVISGIGFLGVGTIIVTGRNEVKGLTTAAGLWVCAGIGLAAGIGFIEGTVLGMICVVIIFRVLEPMDKYLRKRTRLFDVYVEFSDLPAITEFMKEMEAQHVEISSFNTIKEKRSLGLVSATMTLKTPKHGEKLDCLHRMRGMAGVNYVEEI